MCVANGRVKLGEVQFKSIVRENRFFFSFYYSLFCIFNSILIRNEVLIKDSNRDTIVKYKKCLQIFLNGCNKAVTFKLIVDLP